MDTDNLLHFINQYNLVLSVKDNNLVVKDGSQLPSHVMSILKYYKQTIIRLLNQQEVQQQIISFNSHNLIQIRPASNPSAGWPALFFIHPIGGTVGTYYTLANCLSWPSAIYAIQAHGIDDGYRPFNTVSQMALAYQHIILSTQPQSHYYLLGWSFGGILALELAIKLQQKGLPVSFVGLIDSNLQSISGQNKSKDISMRLSFLKDLFPSQTTLSLIESLSDCHANNESDIEDFYHDCLQHGLFPQSMGLSLFSSLFEVYKSNVIAHCSYLPSFFKGTLYQFNAEFSHEKIEDTTLLLASKCTNITSYAVPGGDHYTIMQLPCVEDLASHLSHVLYEISNNRKKQTNITSFCQ